MYNIDDKNAAVFEVQRYLREISRVHNEIPCVTPDGIYDNKTKECVKAFQAQNGLEATGIVDNKTFDLLYKEYLSALGVGEVCLFLLPDKLESQKIQNGEVSITVLIIQGILNSLGIIYDDLVYLETDGIYGAKTEDAVKHIQEIHSLKTDGKITRDTLNAIISDYNYFKNKDT
ncbi:MAG: peptidoglycan-binding protein [Clostridia bacterium]|nr:peptidoglycan-binding protein [Clostridia bacterium]